MVPTHSQAFITPIISPSTVLHSLLSPHTGKKAAFTWNQEQCEKKGCVGGVKKRKEEAVILQKSRTLNLTEV